MSKISLRSVSSTHWASSRFQMAKICMTDDKKTAHQNDWMIYIEWMGFNIFKNISLLHKELSVVCASLGDSNEVITDDLLACKNGYCAFLP